MPVSEEIDADLQKKLETLAEEDQKRFADALAALNSRLEKAIAAKDEKTASRIIFTVYKAAEYFYTYNQVAALDKSLTWLAAVKLPRQMQELNNCFLPLISFAREVLQSRPFFSFSGNGQRFDLMRLTGVDQVLPPPGRLPISLPILAALFEGNHLSLDNSGVDDYIKEFAREHPHILAKLGIVRLEELTPQQAAYLTAEIVQSRVVFYPYYASHILSNDENGKVFVMFPDDLEKLKIDDPALAREIAENPQQVYQRWRRQEDALEMAYQLKSLRYFLESPDAAVNCEGMAMVAEGVFDALKRLGSPYLQNAYFTVFKQAETEFGGPSDGEGQNMMFVQTAPGTWQVYGVDVLVNHPSGPDVRPLDALTNGTRFYDVVFNTTANLINDLYQRGRNFDWVNPRDIPVIPFVDAVVAMNRYLEQEKRPAGQLYARYCLAWLLIDSGDQHYLTAIKSHLEVLLNSLPKTQTGFRRDVQRLMLAYLLMAGRFEAAEKFFNQMEPPPQIWEGGIVFSFAGKKGKGASIAALQELVNKIPHAYKTYAYAEGFLTLAKRRDKLFGATPPIYTTFSRDYLSFQPDGKGYYSVTLSTCREESSLGRYLDGPAGEYQGLFDKNGQLIGLCHSYCHEPACYLFEKPSFKNGQYLYELKDIIPAPEYSVGGKYRVIFSSSQPGEITGLIDISVHSQ